MSPRRVDDQRRNPEHLVDRSSDDVEMLNSNERNHRVGVERPSARHLQDAVGQAVPEPSIGLGGEEDHRRKPDDEGNYGERPG